MTPVTYNIEFPNTMNQAHNIFHVAKVKQYKRPLLREGPWPISIDANGSE